MSDPVAESRKIVDQIRNEVDVLIGVMHMSVEDEMGTEHTGVRSLAQACPEFDLIVAAHKHVLVEGDEINGVLVVENKNNARTLAVVDLTLKSSEDGWKVTERTSKSIEVAQYESDPTIVELVAPFDERAKAYGQEEIGALVGGSLVPDDEVREIPTAILMDTPLIDLIHKTQLHYSEADVSVTALCALGTNVEPGPIRRCDVAEIYRYANTLYVLQMTGAQLRKYMEWAVGGFGQYHAGDLTPYFQADYPVYIFDNFQGVSYTVNVAEEPGNRIEDLTMWLEQEGIELRHEVVPCEQSLARFFPTTSGILKTMAKDAPDYTHRAIDGVENCIAALEDIADGKIHKCFIEMSACVGSCVGGPVMEKYHRSFVEDYLVVAGFAGSEDFDVAQPDVALNF